MNVLHPDSKHGRMLTVQDGWLVCPHCRRNRRLMRIPPDAQAHRIAVWCRECKHEIILDIDRGQSFESRS